MEKIEFHLQDDRLIAAESVGGLPLFFSRIHGVVCVSPSDFEPDFFNNSMNVSNANLSAMGGDVFTPMQSQTMLMDTSNILAPNTTNTGNLSMFALDPEEIRENNRDVASQFKAAFIYHLKRNPAMCQKILGEMFGKSIDHVDSELDKTALFIARDLAEDLPASDPRWQEEIMNRSSTSMQIVQQLREKNFCMIKFTEFLHAVGLWSKFTAVTEKGKVKSTACLLSDLNKKIVASITIKCLHQPHARIIDEGIEMVF